MDLKHIYATIIYGFALYISVSAASSNDTDDSSEITTPTANLEPREETKDPKLFGNPFWLGFTVILFISLVVLSVTISVIYGTYKYRQHAVRRGRYKDKRRVYIEGNENTEGPDYGIFTTEREPESQGESNAAYIGST